METNRSSIEWLIARRRPFLLTEIARRTGRPERLLRSLLVRLVNAGAVRIERVTVRKVQGRVRGIDCTVNQYRVADRAALRRKLEAQPRKHRNSVRESIWRAIRFHKGKPFTPEDVVNLTDAKRASVMSFLKVLTEAGYVGSVAEGRYRLVNDTGVKRPAIKGG